jgi:hypothetical protein
MLQELEKAIKKEQSVMDLSYVYNAFIDKNNKNWIIESADMKGTMETFLTPMEKLWKEYGEPTLTELKPIEARVLEIIKRKTSSTAKYLYSKLVEELKAFENNTVTWLMFTSFIERIFQDIKGVQATATVVGLLSYENAETNNKSSYASTKQSEKNSSKDSNKKKREYKAKEPLATACRGCGSNRHLTKDCSFTKHPNYNSDHSRAWEDTEQYKTLQTRSKGKFTWLLPHISVDGVAIATAEGDSRAHKRQKGNDYLFNLITNDPLPSNDNIYILTNIATGDSTLSLSALIDSGAIHANYCSRKVATWVKKQQQQDASKHRCKLSKEESNVSSISILADSHNTIISKEVVSFDFIFFNELTKSFDTLSCLKFYVIESNIDLIVGLPTISENIDWHRNYLRCLREKGD